MVRLPDDPLKRSQFFLRLRNKPRDLSHEEWLDLYRSLSEEQDLDTRTLGISVLAWLKEWSQTVVSDHANRSFRDLFWKPFHSAESPSAVVAVSEQGRVPDVLALLDLRGTLSKASCRATDFHLVELTEPDWRPLDIGNLTAICFVGRPASFEGCSLVDDFPSDRVFELPADAFGLRGQPVTEQSAEIFHHVQQNRSQAGALKFKSEQHPEANRVRREDFAVVQRVVVRHGAKNVVMLVLAGSTSLGAYAAAQWATSEHCDIDFQEALAQAGNDPRSIEVFVQVRGMIHDPPRLWDPDEITVKKIFINGKRFADRGPATITIGLRGRKPIDVAYVLFDDDELRIRNANVLAALVAVCLKASSSIRAGVMWPCV